MALISVASTLEFTDRMGGLYEAAGAPLAALAAGLQGLSDQFYGGASNGGVSIGDPNATNAVGTQVLRSVATAQGTGFYSLVLTNVLGGMGSYVAQFGGVRAGLPASVIDVASYLRYANGCPDPSPAGGGEGSTYASLAHPSYAALINALLGGAFPMPPDTVFAPTGVVLGGFDAAAGAFTGGGVLMTAGGAPYAPTASFTAATPPAPASGAAPALPNGSCFVTLSGLNQAGAAKTWRGDIGTGLAAAGQRLAVGVLQGTAGGASGGTAAPGDLLVRVTGVARDASVSGGGTATRGVIQIVTVALRPTR